MAGTILNEIYILEAGSQTVTLLHYLQLHRFILQLLKTHCRNQRQTTVPILQRPSPPQYVMLSKTQSNILTGKLCFNCLGHHKASSAILSTDVAETLHKPMQSRTAAYWSASSGTYWALITTCSTHWTLITTCTYCTNAATSHPIPPTTTRQQLNNNPPPKRPVISNTTDTASLSMTLPPSHTKRNSVCLLKTAIATVTRSTTANLLFDEGSQRSFITQDLASSLALQPKTSIWSKLSPKPSDRCRHDQLTDQ